MLMSGYLHSRKKEWGIRVLPEQRVQVTATSFRVPDITVVLGGLPTVPILREPPFLCIEILSRDDSMADMQERIEDYLAFGVAHVWVVNPKKLRAFYCTADGMREAKDGVLRTENPEITVPILQLEDL
jgi:Uma2 family endonuclease